MNYFALLRHIRKYDSDRQVHRELGIGRRTVKKYREWAKEQGLLEGPLPKQDELQKLVRQTLRKITRRQNVSSVEPYRDIVLQMCREKQKKIEIWEKLNQHGFPGSYSSVCRFVNSLELPPIPKEYTSNFQPANTGIFCDRFSADFEWMLKLNQGGFSENQLSSMFKKKTKLS